VTDAPAGRVFDVDDLYQLGPGVLAQMYAGHGWHETAAAPGGLTEIIPTVAAIFVPSRRSTDVSTETDSWLRRFCDGEFTSGRIANEGSEAWALNAVRTALAALLAPFAMAIGPPDERIMEYEWAVVWTHPHGHAWSMGVHELVEKDLGTFITHIGWDQIDTRLHEAHAMRRYHSVLAETARTLIAGVAAVTGTDYSTELEQVIRDGGGQLALWRLTGRLALAGGGTDVAAMIRPPALVAFRRALEASLNHAAAHWADAPHDLTDSTLDEMAGVDIGERGIAAVLGEMRRFRAAARGLADPSVLGDAIAKAAEASTHSIEDDMALVFDAMEHLSDPDE